MIRSLIRELDPRFFKVISVSMPTEEERRWPFLKRYVQSIPEAGKVLFLDSGWMDETVRERLRGGLSEREYARRLESVRMMERQLAAGGYLLVKLFLHIDRERQRKRLKKLASHKDTAWRAGENDWRQNKNYGRTLDAFQDFMSATDAPWARWKVIDGSPCRPGAAGSGGLAVPPDLHRPGLPARSGAAEEGVAPAAHGTPVPGEIGSGPGEKEYRKQLKKCRKELAELHNELYRKKVPVVIVYEGWDAAGKGGNIKRLASALDPRGYEVIPIAAPTHDELARHYLWRFWERLPKTGHIAIFDRSWYGRVMVERLEGFCSEAEWQRAYDEINEFERELTDAGTVVVKFWVQIDKDTQLARFRERQNTPEKQWKITEEDWRNREKWDAYEEAVDEMLARTSTERAPWHILESVDKRYARIKAMRLVIGAIRQTLDR